MPDLLLAARLIVLTRGDTFATESDLHCQSQTLSGLVNVARRFPV